MPLNQAAPTDDELVEHFNREFAAPNDNLERKFNLELDQALESHSCDLEFCRGNPENSLRVTETKEKNILAVLIGYVVCISFAGLRPL